ncbi:hypothetical protein AMATHDRAFT_75520 [Amanita thiersii Skay4041]|uniref:CHCH domain-containing protein n=1 Tax=Amanita thiersii Skay4041 TaxID=703135 RepID=A0A2A9NMT8_9AGAR|nr:hypothetical protein AMATHDRAFT_75520 [Amanita thiersii Skay4041]
MAEAMRSSSRFRSSAPARSTSASSSTPSQSRGAHTAAVPAGYRSAPAPAPPANAATATQTASSSQPGLLTQMAATAGSVAVGSTIGHGISSMLFGGGGSSAAEVEKQAPPVQQQQYQSGVNCEAQAKEFTKCLEKADLPSCTWYLEQLKACQAAAAPY